MKKIIISLAALFSIAFFVFSCGDSDNEVYGDYDITDGVWTINSRTISTNASDNLDKNTNWYLKTDGDTLRIEQTFNKADKTSRIVAYSKKSDKEVRNSNYGYDIKGDSLYLTNPFTTTDTVMRGAFSVTKKRLMINYKVTKKELSPILLELYSDNNILDGYSDDLKGTYTLTSNK